MSSNPDVSPSAAPATQIGSITDPAPRGAAFVLGGGGHLGAHEVGMLQALLERGIAPSLIVGTSVGAINGAVVAAAPTAETVGRLEQVWSRMDEEGVFDGSILSRLTTLARTRTHLHGNEALRRLLADVLPERIEDLATPFQCVAASIERASEHWFDRGPLVEAVMASAAVPGVLPAVELDGEHFLDGGIVNSIPVARAVELGARTIYVLHVGRVDRPLVPPRWPWEVALVAFEIARRHRFIGDLARLPEDVTVHVLPTGQTDPPRYNDLSQLRYRDTSHIAESITRARAATARYLDAIAPEAA
ncbi:MAG TPA: patatin-like phospholipase family protein [Solirubrobacteraceae bacterium]|nr:patatin-like phospholipase family protein [Solirubrobacteraceae bacterium]